jgi:hypothetical protein
MIIWIRIKKIDNKLNTIKREDMNEDEGGKKIKRERKKYYLY